MMQVNGLNLESIMLLLNATLEVRQVVEIIKKAFHVIGKGTLQVCLDFSLKYDDCMKVILKRI
jgi:hypothetical protein